MWKKAREGGSEDGFVLESRVQRRIVGEDRVVASSSNLWRGSLGQFLGGEIEWTIDRHPETLLQ
jgi:hypothetical protein